MDIDYKPLTSPYTWDLVDYEEKSKLKIGDIVAIRSELITSSSTLKGHYEVISYNTKNGKYGIIPISSLFNLPMYYTKEELVLIKSANAEPLSATKGLEALGKFIKSINEEKPLNIKIAKKQIKLNFKN